MKLGQRILIHSLLAALPLAVVGYILAQLAGLWTSSHSSPRVGPTIDAALATASDGDVITAALEWRLPLAMALGGIIFVAVGECLLALWRPTQAPPDRAQS